MPNDTESSNATLAPQPSQSSKGDCPVRRFTETEKWLQVSSLLLIVVLSVFGNTVVIYIIKKNRRLHNPTNYFILNLCLANLMIMLVNTSPYILGRIAPHLGFVVSGLAGTILCKLQGFLATCTINAAILTLAVIAADRFIAVFFPMRKAISSRKAIWLIAGSWIAPALPSTLFLYVNTLFEFQGTVYCVERWEPNIPFYVNTLYSTADLILFYALPLLEIIIFYSAIIYKVWMRKIPGQVSCANQQLEVKVKKNVLKVLIIAVLTFAMLWLPMKIRIVIWLIGNALCGVFRTPLALFLTLLLACMNCAINPFIYLLFSRDYRNGFKALFRCFRLLGRSLTHMHSWSMNTTESANTGRQVGLTLTSFKKVEST
ncbi:substance-K receptor-like [Montipora capricornis]|uniref:substance-K receptor-like n=1 Tax=Montipora capricornis TaxID=246305 RepID=UPI0035F15C90